METLEYEMTRNLTLLFFLERLLERGEPRTLHDLSCQFGSKGFTKEMRQIAGGSQSGKNYFRFPFFSFFFFFFFPVSRYPKRSLRTVTQFDKNHSKPLLAS